MAMIGVGLNQVAIGVMLSDTFDVRQRVSTRGDNGRAYIEETLTTGIAGIVDAESNDLERTADWAAGKKVIMVITPFLLKSQGEGVMPDLVMWRGDEYTVTDVEDYSQLAIGYVEARCECDTAQDKAPGGHNVR